MDWIINNPNTNIVVPQRQNAATHTDNNGNILFEKNATAGTEGKASLSNSPVIRVIVDNEQIRTKTYQKYTYNLSDNI